MAFVKKQKIITATRLILEKISELGEITFDAFFPPNYSYTRISRKLFGLDSHPEIAPKTLSVILSRLRNQGLISRKGTRKASIWQITKQGKKFLTNHPRIEIPEKDGITRLVIFDIPERERRKRDTLRAELISYNYQRLQKSVWIGWNALPEDFIDLVDELDLQKHIHIFSVQEAGTIQES